MIFFFSPKVEIYHFKTTNWGEDLYVRIKHLFLLNSANVALFLNTISDSYAKKGNQDLAGPPLSLFSGHIFSGIWVMAIFDLNAAIS